MKSVFSMWKNTRMIILTAVCAAMYGAALIAYGVLAGGLFLIGVAVFVRLGLSWGAVIPQRL